AWRSTRRRWRRTRMCPTASPACGTGNGWRISRPRCDKVRACHRMWRPICNRPPHPVRAALEVGVRVFRIAYTGDFLNAAGQPAYGDLGLPLFEGKPFIEYRFLADQVPAPGDPAYWQRYYSLELGPEHLVGVDGLVVLRPAVRRAAFAHGAGDLV